MTVGSGRSARRWRSRRRCTSRHQWGLPVGKHPIRTAAGSIGRGQAGCTKREGAPHHVHTAPPAPRCLIKPSKQRDGTVGKGRHAPAPRARCGWFRLWPATLSTREETALPSDPAGTGIQQGAAQRPRLRERAPQCTATASVAGGWRRPTDGAGTARLPTSTNAACSDRWTSCRPLLASLHRHDLVTPRRYDRIDYESSALSSSASAAAHFVPLQHVSAAEAGSCHQVVAASMTHELPGVPVPRPRPAHPARSGQPPAGLEGSRGRRRPFRSRRPTGIHVPGPAAPIRGRAACRPRIPAPGVPAPSCWRRS